jgi:hypothetical protein
MQSFRKIRKITKAIKDIDIDNLDLSSLSDLDIGGVMDNMEDLYITTKVNERLLLAIADKLQVEINSENLKAFVNEVYSDIKKQRQKDKDKKDKEENKEDD